MQKSIKKFGLIGFNIDYSFSKKFFEEKFINEKIINCSYENFDINSIELILDIIKDNNIKGYAVYEKLTTNSNLLKINGLSIISHVSKIAEEANIGEVIVATEDQEIIDDVKGNGFNAILTSNKHKTGTDKIHEALKKSNV